MKILFFHGNCPDYVANGLFHGLRSLLGENCVDIPRYDSMYAPLTDKIRAKLRGNGFTLYGLLSEIPQLADSRYFWRQDLDKYDLIIVAHVWELWSLFWEISAMVEPEKLIIIDGYDPAAFFPYISLGWRLKNYPWTYLTPVGKHKYFKRELIGEGASYGLERFLPRALRRWIPLPKNALPISFSIPAAKIFRVDSNTKIKDFPTHIVDREIATQTKDAFFSAIGSDQHFFASETEYYQDLQKSRFGITTKRAGWDCLRHYELAASGCVLCFRDLDLKPKTCAPHGLNESNCLIYHNLDELKAKISALTQPEYLQLQTATYQWINNNTTVARAQQFLQACFPEISLPIVT